MKNILFIVMILSGSQITAMDCNILARLCVGGTEVVRAMVRNVDNSNIQKNLKPGEVKKGPSVCNCCTAGAVLCCIVNQPILSAGCSILGCCDEYGQYSDRKKYGTELSRFSRCHGSFHSTAELSELLQQPVNLGTEKKNDV